MLGGAETAWNLQESGRERKDANDPDGCKTPETQKGHL